MQPLLQTSVTFCSLLQVGKHSRTLGLHSLLLALSGSLGLRTLGIHFVLEGSLALLLGLGTVNLFNIKSAVMSTLVESQEFAVVYVRAQQGRACA